MCSKDEMMHDARDEERIARSAEAIATASDVRQVEAWGRQFECLICGRTGAAAIVVVTPATGKTEVGPHVLACVCRRCSDAAGEARAAAVTELVQTAERCEQLLTLLRQRAGNLLAPWWGTVGACGPEDLDAASVAVRRSIERLGRP